MRPVTTERQTPARRVMTPILVVALLALPVVWLGTYLYRPEEGGVEYTIGRYSLLLGAAAAVALVVERVRGQAPWAAAAATTLAWVAVLLGKVVGAGDRAFPWVIAACAVVALAGAGMPGAHRRAAVRVGVVLAVVSGVGLLGLA
ncbi:hypothetical protein N803_06250 [Knoellia subterranea KCTC 19937]|uniref:Uncharacterized protein n=2 Tax=Knoellia TaxID=136099 RepID=A0A0A0JEC2_9MICO|nr:hypothetical protein N803_06250 [Knoellia subterranea KCTC 19937]